jgi:hypothetical protein
MRRREFIGLVGGAAAMWPLAGDAQQPKIAKLGFVSWQSPAASDQIEFLREGLAQLGYVEGRNISLEAWFTDGNRERTQAALRAFVEKPVDVLIARVTPAALLAKEATQTIPIVMIVADPLATGLVPSLSRPGANLTGTVARFAGPRRQTPRTRSRDQARYSNHCISRRRRTTNPVFCPRNLGGGEDDGIDGCGPDCRQPRYGRRRVV